MGFQIILLSQFFIFNILLPFYYASTTHLKLKFEAVSLDDFLIDSSIIILVIKTWKRLSFSFFSFVYISELYCCMLSSL